MDGFPRAQERCLVGRNRSSLDAHGVLSACSRRAWRIPVAGGVALAGGGAYLRRGKPPRFLRRFL